VTEKGIVWFQLEIIGRSCL